VAPTRVLVVCLANQCRSPMAEFLLARKLEAAGASRSIEVDSAGIEATPGLPATRASRRAVQRRYGEDFLAGHRAGLLTPALLAHSDLVLVMTRGQKALLVDQWRGVVEGIDRKLFTVGEYAGKPAVDVDDPVGGDDARYDACLTLLEDLTAKAAEKLTAKHASA
jgi:protein-tyrosine phosphatase